ncbi:MAG: D-alanyl-D-alanine dipeptidase [Saprospiraceae bacterium]|nr:D-alanyl-D-alanine dipeptidase [Saprospiraceae bacterium]
MKLLLCCLLVLNTLLVACQNDTPRATPPRVPPSTAVIPTQDSILVADTLMAEHHEESPTADMKAAPANSGTPSPTKPTPGIKPGLLAQHGFTEVITLDPSIRLDIRYATTDNFTKAKIYDCPRCLLRPAAAAAIAKAHKMLQKKGLGLKMFDCYRPRPYQQRLWDKVPNADYVTPPAKGSMHSRGAAVDLTIVDASGKELDMGTPYDFFGVAAHTDHANLPAKVLANRRLLRETLEAVGFRGIRTEWWHFSFQGKNYPLSDYVWPCDK